jgi:hypothetical protein
LVRAVFKPVGKFLLVTVDEGFVHPETETRINSWIQNYEKDVKFVGAVFKPVKTFLLVSANEGFF